MNLRSLLNRRHADSLPLLPASDTVRPPRPLRKRGGRDLEERLERLLTPTELDIVEHRHLAGDGPFG